jgi:hypothetical protein
MGGNTHFLDVWRLNRSASSLYGDSLSRSIWPRIQRLSVYVVNDVQTSVKGNMRLASGVELK